MRILFSIEFEFEQKTYSGIVRIMEQSAHIEYHVRVMNARLDKWLYYHHIFYQERDGSVTYKPTSCSQKVQLLRVAVHEGLKARLLKQVTPLLTSSRRRTAGGGSSYYVHRIGGPDF